MAGGSMVERVVVVVVEDASDLLRIGKLLTNESPGATEKLGKREMAEAASTGDAGAGVETGAKADTGAEEEVFDMKEVCVTEDGVAAETREKLGNGGDSAEKDEGWRAGMIEDEGKEDDDGGISAGGTAVDGKEAKDGDESSESKREMDEEGA